MKIYQNVIVKTLSSISFAGAYAGGQWYIYRNLIDFAALRRAIDHDAPAIGGMALWAFPKGWRAEGTGRYFPQHLLVYAQEKQA